jgi:hypothetical protein
MIKYLYNIKSFRAVVGDKIANKLEELLYIDCKYPKNAEILYSLKAWSHDYEWIGNRCHKRYATYTNESYNKDFLLEDAILNIEDKGNHWTIEIYEIMIYHFIFKGQEYCLQLQPECNDYNRYQIDLINQKIVNNNPLHPW